MKKKVKEEKRVDEVALTKERMNQIKKLVIAWEEDERLKEEHPEIRGDSITSLLLILTEPFSATPSGDRLNEKDAKWLQRASSEIRVSIDELKQWFFQLAIRKGWYPRPGETLEQLRIRRGETI